MKKSLLSLFIAVSLALSGVYAHAGEVTSQAIVTSVTGHPSVTIPGQTQAFVPKVGDKLSQGTTIKTGEGGRIVIQAFSGAYSKILQNTDVSLEKLSVTTDNGAVSKQTAMLNLKVGTILTTIDPANHNINDYGIRTPMGVAAARGTAYSVTVDPDGVTHIFVTDSVVTFKNTLTGATTTIPAGTAVRIGPTGDVTQQPYADIPEDQKQQLVKDYGRFQEVGDGQVPLPPSQYIDPSIINGGSTSQSPSS